MSNGTETHHGSVKKKDLKCFTCKYLGKSILQIYSLIKTDIIHFGDTWVGTKHSLFAVDKLELQLLQLQLK